MVSEPLPRTQLDEAIGLIRLRVENLLRETHYSGVVERLPSLMPLFIACYSQGLADAALALAHGQGTCTEILKALGYTLSHGQETQESPPSDDGPAS